ncbi:MAG: transglutaminase domain-containing protein [Bacillota bacterium]|nr:transglutaminase domain-containing protein [Bacillota bacterium]
MIADRYYYNKLSTKEKQIYKDFYTGLKNCASVIKTATVLNPEKAMDRIFKAIINDNPHIYYVDQTKMAYQYSVHEIEIHPAYIFPKSQIASLNQRFEDKANDILSTVITTSKNNELSKETALYEYFARNFSYDATALKATDPIELCRAHSLLGVFLDGSAVCEGFAKAFKFLMNAMDMKCIVISGYADWDYESKHAWNIVKINDKSYHVDVTWAISDRRKDLVWYDYLNVSDKTISIDHSGFSGVPKCNNDDLDYFLNVAPQIDNMIYLKNHIRECIKNREPSTTFKLLKGKEKHGIKDLSQGLYLIQEAAQKAQLEAAGVGFKMDMYERKQRHNYVVFFEYNQES